MPTQLVRRGLHEHLLSLGSPAPYPLTCAAARTDASSRQVFNWNLVHFDHSILTSRFLSLGNKSKRYQPLHDNSAEFHRVDSSSTTDIWVGGRCTYDGEAVLDVTCLCLYAAILDNYGNCEW